MVHSIARSINSTVCDYNLPIKMNDIRKQNLTLDLHKGNSRIKKNSFETPLLSTPDLQNFALNQSEVEEMLTDPSMNFQTPTPTTVRSLLAFNKSEPDLYAEDNMPSVYESSHTIMNGLAKNGLVEYDYEDQYPESLAFNMESMGMKIKDEPQMVPNVSPPVSPVNMDSQERLKADRKKARNRLAAAKCRKKKLERIALLETRVKELKDENNELGQKQATLKKEVTSLKERIVRHYQSGCSIMPQSVPVQMFWHTRAVSLRWLKLPKEPYCSLPSSNNVYLSTAGVTFFSSLRSTIFFWVIPFVRIYFSFCC